MVTASIRFRVDFGDRCAIGPGKIALLETIARTGSLSQAARDLKMSYRRAWLLLNSVNTSFRRPVAALSTGGGGGGGGGPAAPCARGGAPAALWRTGGPRLPQARGASGTTHALGIRGRGPRRARQLEALRGAPPTAEGATSRPARVSGRGPARAR